MRFYSFFILRGMMVSVLATASAASAQTLAVSGDTFVSPGTTANYSTSPTVNVGGAGNYQGLIQFDLSGLPAGTSSASVSKASITLFVNKLGSPGAIDIYAANGSWTEAAVNGDNAPSPGLVIASQLPVTTASTYITIDATALVKAWLDGTFANSGILILADPSSASTSVLFDSKESSTTSHPASLQVTLAGTGAQGPSGLQGAQGPQGPAGPQGVPGSQGAQGLSGASTAQINQRTTFSFSPVLSSHTLLDPQSMATLTFTASATGTALFSGRGICSLTSSDGDGDAQGLLIAAASSSTAARQLQGSPNSDTGLVQQPYNVAAGDTYYYTWSAETTLPVIAGTSYTEYLYAVNLTSGSGQGSCTGSFSVRTY
jgi:hypothetical protein